MFCALCVYGMREEAAKRERPKWKRITQFEMTYITHSIPWYSFNGMAMLQRGFASRILNLNRAAGTTVVLVCRASSHGHSGPHCANVQFILSASIRIFRSYIFSESAVASSPHGAYTNSCRSNNNNNSFSAIPIHLDSSR